MPYPYENGLINIKNAKPLNNMQQNFKYTFPIWYLFIYLSVLNT